MPEKVKAALEALSAEPADVEAAKILLEEALAMAEPVGVEEPLEQEPDASAAATDDEKAALGKMVALLGKDDAGEALLELEDWAKAHASRVTAMGRVEAIERRAAVKSLIASGAEKPATAYTDVATAALCPRLAAESLDSLKARAKAMAKKGEIKPPPDGSDDAIKLSATAQAYCKKHNLTPAAFAAMKSNSVRRTPK